MNESGRKWDKNQNHRQNESAGSVKRLCVVMMNGFELIGDLIESPSGCVTLNRPFLLQRQGPNLNLVDMMKIGVLKGESIELNMNNHLWVGEPSEAVEKVYKMQRSGLVLQGTLAANQ
jgi:hypothetical protein